MEIPISVYRLPGLHIRRSSHCPHETSHRGSDLTSAEPRVTPALLVRSLQMLKTAPSAGGNGATFEIAGEFPPTVVLSRPVAPEWVPQSSESGGALLRTGSAPRSAGLIRHSDMRQCEERGASVGPLLC